MMLIRHIVGGRRRKKKHELLCSAWTHVVVYLFVVPGDRYKLGIHLCLFVCYLAWLWPITCAGRVLLDATPTISSSQAEWHQAVSWMILRHPDVLTKLQTLLHESLACVSWRDVTGREVLHEWISCTWLFLSHFTCLGGWNMTWHEQKMHVIPWPFRDPNVPLTRKNDSKIKREEGHSEREKK